MAEAGVWREVAPAKLNLALHVRARLPNGYHELETVFAFCTDGDVLEGGSAEAEATGMSLALGGPFAPDLDAEGENLVERAWAVLTAASGVTRPTWLRLDKRLPVSAGIGGGSADAAAALRLLTAMWGIDPAHASAVAPQLGADVPACLLSLTARGSGTGTALELLDDPAVTGTPVLLVNPRVPLSTKTVFEAWDGADRGPLGEWRDGRNDLEAPARVLVPAIGQVLDWLGRRPAVTLARMSGSGATCFALFASEGERDLAAANCPLEWWHLASTLR